MACLGISLNIYIDHFLCPIHLFVEWSREQVKKWVSSLFGDNVGDRFYEEEIDGRALMESKRLEEDKVLSRLGISTIGKKERFERELRAIRPEMNSKGIEISFSYDVNFILNLGLVLC